MAHAPKRRVSRITVPARCHAAVKVIFAEMQRQSITYDELEYRSGVLKSTFKAWRTNNRPGLETVEAALGALGWAFLPVPTLSQLPPSIRQGLESLAAEWGDVNPLLCELLARVCGVKITSALERKLPSETHQSQISEERRLRDDLQQFSERRLVSAVVSAERIRENLTKERDLALAEVEKLKERVERLLASRPPRRCWVRSSPADREVRPYA